MRACPGEVHVRCYTRGHSRVHSPFPVGDEAAEKNDGGWKPPPRLIRKRNLDRTLAVAVPILTNRNDGDHDRGRNDGVG